MTDRMHGIAPSLSPPSSLIETGTAAMKKLACYAITFACTFTAMASALAQDAPPVHERMRQQMRAAVAAPVAVQNPGFEESDPMYKLPSWSAITHGGDPFRIEPDTSQAYAGKQSLIIENTGKHSWGGAVQMLGAANLAGQEVEMAVQVKLQGVTAPGFHIALKAIQPGVEPDYIQTKTELVGDSDWKAVKLRAKLPKTITKVELVLLLDGDGRAWVDEVRLAPVADEQKQK